jgi:hypothetical protein
MKEPVSEGDVQSIVDAEEPGVGAAIRTLELIEAQYLAAAAAIEVSTIGYSTTTTAGPMVGNSATGA